MCGFAGRFHSVALPADPMWHERADARLAHRGPDGSGHYQDALCELVHRRLALVDLSPTGAQPMANEDGSVYVVFNGEIYNHRDLRANLQSRGHRFRGTSDTEVLVHLYEELGVEMAARLQGMFAFAIYDRRARRLLLVRDRFGIKPLFYAAHQEQLVFASEMKALLALTGFRPSIDRQACYDFMGLGYVPEPLTGFAEIRALPKGTAHLVTPEGQQVVKFHQVRANPSVGRNLTDAAEAVSQTLLRAVERQSVADVPVAALLSGGIDSSLVVGAYCRATNKPPQTFNVRFPDKKYDETDVAQSVAGQYQTRHETIDLGESTLGPDVVQRLLRHFDQPFADSSLIPMYAISRAIRDRGVICTLSGDGGDEAFGGYGRFWRANKLVQLMRRLGTTDANRGRGSTSKANPELGPAAFQGNHLGSGWPPRLFGCSRRTIQLFGRETEAGVSFASGPRRVGGRLSALRRVCPPWCPEFGRTLTAHERKPFCRRTSVGHAPQGRHDEHAGRH